MEINDTVYYTKEFTNIFKECDTKTPLKILEIDRNWAKIQGYHPTNNWIPINFLTKN